MNQRSIRVWDLPTRLFHWLLLVLVVGAIVSVNMGGDAMVWHGRFGHMIFGLIVFRLVWGIVGSTHARFWNFVPRPSSMTAYLRGQWRGLGHNPLGALSVFALLGLIGFQATIGLFANDDIAFRGPLAAAVSPTVSDDLSTIHRQMEPFILGLIALHVAAVLFHRLFRKVDLITPMITGDKKVSEPDAEHARGGGWLALLITLAVTAVAIWGSSGSWIEPPPPAPDLGW